MPNWFFLSHASIDREPENYDSQSCVSKFYHDLIKELRRRRGADSQGFIDETCIQLGDRWADSLDEALSTCRVLVCMYSRGYFNSSYCGKEFQLFDSRLSQYPANLLQGVQRPPLILPVLFSGPEDVLPLKPVVSGIHYLWGEYPEVYKEAGLLSMMRRKSLQEDYLNFLEKFVDRLIKAAEKWDWLPGPQSLPKIEGAPSAWEMLPATGQPPPAPQGPPEADPLQNADFVYIAASQREIGSLQTAQPRLNRYGDQGGLDFKPYYPTPPNTVGFLAEVIATKEGFNYQPAPIPDNLIEQIRRARRSNRIVIIIVDSWTLQLPRYKLLAGQYDELDPLNSSMLIVWDDNDPATTQNRPDLEDTIKSTFHVKIMRKDELIFKGDINSQSVLEKFLPSVLHELKTRIFGDNETFRTAGEGEPVPRLGGK